MTNFELNKAIVEALYPGSQVKKDDESEGIYVAQKKFGYIFHDYCNDWNDLMPIVLRHHIQMYVHSENHFNICDGDVKGFHEEAVHINNVQRALAECLLKVLTGDKK